MKSRDNFGKPIMLNYQGKESFKTVPGGILSTITLLLVLGYAFLKGKYMVDKEEWSLIQQTVMATRADLIKTKDLSEAQYSNISIGIQFYEKRERLTVKGKNSSNVSTNSSRRILRQNSKNSTH